MFDLYWNSTTKQVSYTTLPTLPLGSNYRPLNWRTPSSSSGPSIFSITSLSSNNPIQVSTQFYGRLYCGDGLVFTTGVTTPEQCDSVPNCNPITCQCPNGASGPNTCNILPTPVAPPVTAPVSPPVVPPVTPPVAVPVPVSSPVDVPVATPVAPPVDVPAAVPSSTTPVATPMDTPIATPIASPVATPLATPSSPVPVAPIASPTSDTTPAGQQAPAAPIAVPAAVNPAEPGNSTGIVSDPIAPVSEAGASVAVIVPAVVVPVAVASAGVAALVVLLQRRKKKKQSEKASGSSGDDGEDPKSERVKLEPVNYFAVPTPSPELGKDSNTSAGSVGSNASLVSMGSNATIHNPLGEPLPDTPPGTLTSLNTTNRSRTTDDRMDIPYSELKFVKEIGAGAFGKVFLGEWQKTKVAMKISSISSSDEFIREAELLINLRPHPNVVQILGISADGVNVVMIMEFCDGGSLDSLVFKKNPPMSDKIHLLSGIAKGIYHLHKNKIVHRDLAARNILLSRGEPKISDFGMSRKVQEATAHGTTKATVGPIRWMAPECLRSAKYSTKSDVWSFGVLCWEVLSGEEPHLNSDPLTIGVAIRDQGITPLINSEWDPALQSLMMDCWALDPEKRPGFDEICERLSRLDE